MAPTYLIDIMHILSQSSREFDPEGDPPEL